MCEDDKPIYDFEADWEVAANEKSRIAFKNKKLPSLYRVIDIDKQSIIFSDIERLVSIKNIDKLLTKSDNEEENLSRFKSLCNMILDQTSPITMPYKQEKLTCFIENFPGFDMNYDDTVGILYFREENDKKNMIPCKRFFRIHPIGAAVRYEEIDFTTYNAVKTDWYERSKDGKNSRPVQNDDSKH